MKSLLALLFALTTAQAQLLSPEELEQRIEGLSDAKTEEAVLEIWKQAAARSQQLVDIQKRTVDFEQKIKAPFQAASLPFPTAIPGKSSLTKHLERQENLGAILEDLNARVAELSEQLKQNSQRTADLASVIAGERSQLAEIQIPIETQEPLSQAQLQLALLDKAYLEEAIAHHRAEQAYLRLEAKRLPEKIARRKAHLIRLEKEQQSVTEIITRLRQKEAVSTRQSLAQFSDKLSHIPEINDIIQEVGQLNKLRTHEGELQEKIQEAQSYLKSIKESRRRINAQETNASQRINLLEEAELGIDTKTGLILREQRAKLPRIDELSKQLRRNSQIAAQTQIKIEELGAQRDFDPPLTEDQITALETDHPDLDRATVTELFKERRKLLNKLIEDHSELNTTLGQATEISNGTIKDIKRYSQYLDERLLWIKSAPPFSLAEPLTEWERFLTLFSPQKLHEAWCSARANLMSALVPGIALLALSLFSLIRRRWLCAMIKNCGELAGRRNCTSILPTVKTIAASIALASTLPIFCLFLAIFINSPEVYRSGLLKLAAFLFCTSLLLKFTRENGLFVSHFKFSKTDAATIFRNTAWFLPLMAPFVFLIATLTSISQDTVSGRTLFILGMMPVAYFAHRLFRPTRSVLKQKSLTTLRGVYFLSVLTPIGFAIGAALGYFESVLILRAQTIGTLAILLLAFLITQFLTRWILVSKRRLAIAQALRRREAAVAEREAKQEGSHEKAHDIPSLEEVKAEAVDVVEVQEQTTQLVRLGTNLAVFFGIWAIWSTTFTALSILDDVTLWGEITETQQVDRAEKNSPPIPGLSTISGDAENITRIVAPSGDRVSLQDLLLCILFLALTFIGARNIPGLLSLTLFNRFNLGQGGNFALTTTARYLIVFIGIVLALGKIAITWSKVQWLAAAITLGIGFGLQEIFANFVAGIILLFERPIRLGDVVTVGDVSGRVTQIKIRATTIQQFNNRELLVPNKEFITSQLINWTLKDSLLRLEVNVGIAYGSDTQKATSVLEKILQDHPQILTDPKPDILFTSFGNSTLDFQVRGFVCSVEQFVRTQSDLHYRIDEAFREANIEIAFPQQDIHIRSLPEGFRAPSG